MIKGNVSGPLYPLLEYESQKSGCNILYNRLNFKDLKIDESFKDEIVILVHNDGNPQAFRLPVEGEMVSAQASDFCGEELPGVPVGPIVAGELVPLAHVTGRHILIPFDLEGLESNTPNIINYIFGEIVTLALDQAIKYIKTNDWEKEKSLFVQVMTKTLVENLEKMNTNIEENTESINYRTNDIVTLINKNNELKEIVEALNKTSFRRRKENALRDFTQMMKLIPQVYKTIVFDEFYLKAETNPIEIEFNNYTYEMGRFEIKIGFGNDTLEIRNLEENKCVRGHAHPHVGSDGYPCLGNISVTIDKLLADKQYTGLLILLHKFLCSYNLDNPFEKIENWNPDWEDNDENDYDDCYENSSTWDCVECNDTDCPYWEDRFERCQEFAELERCLSCKQCPQWQIEVEACRQDHKPSECVTCDLSNCPWAGNEEECYEIHNGNDCTNCSHTSCRYFKERE